MASILTVLSTISFVLLLIVPERKPATYPMPSHPQANLTTALTPVPSTLSAVPTEPEEETTVLPPHNWGLTSIRFDATFLWLVLVRTFAFTFLNPVFNLSDAMVYAMFARVLRAQAAEREVVRGYRSGSLSGTGSGFGSATGLGSSSNLPSPGSVNGEADAGETAFKIFSSSSDPLSVTELERMSQWVAEKPEDPAARVAHGYGLTRGVGALGWLGISGLAAIVMQVILRGRPITETFPYMLMALVVTHAAAATNFIFFSPGRITSQTDYLHHVGILLRNKELIKTYVMATLQGMLNAQFETYIYWYWRNCLYLS